MLQGSKMSVSLMMMMVMISLVTIPTVKGQVNREIDQFEDLLAVDSFDNEVNNFTLYFCKKICF